MACFVFDASPLSHFARAGHLRTLEELTAGHRRVVTTAVCDELRRGIVDHPELAAIDDAGWLEQVPLNEIPALEAFARYAERLGSGIRDVGEAATLAWAEVNAATAIIDEAAGRKVGKERGVDVHGSLWLIANALSAGLLTEADAVALVDMLRQTEAWLPCGGADFVEWCRREGLL